MNEIEKIKRKFKNLELTDSPIFSEVAYYQALQERMEILSVNIKPVDTEFSIAEMFATVGELLRNAMRKINDEEKTKPLT
jgi:hypothetical protein